MQTTKRRDLRIEAHFLPDDLADLVELRERILASGQPEQVAHGIVGWLVAKSAGERDSLSSRTRASYRKVLADVAGVPEDDPDGLVSP